MDSPLGVHRANCSACANSESFALKPLCDFMFVPTLDLDTPGLDEDVLCVDVEFTHERLAQGVEVSEHLSDNRKLPRVVVADVSVHWQLPARRPHYCPLGWLPAARFSRHCPHRCRSLQQQRALDSLR